MPELQTWACPKCKTTVQTPIAANGYYKPCRCGNKKEWTYVSGPPRPQDRDVRSGKQKEKK